MKKLLFFFIITALGVASASAALKTATTANWNPTAGSNTAFASVATTTSDSIKIPSGVTVTVTGIVTCGALYVEAGGTIIFSSSSSRQVLVVGGVGGNAGTITLDGTVTMNNSSSSFFAWNGPGFYVGTGNVWTWGGTNTSNDGGIHYTGTTGTTVFGNGKTIGTLTVTGAGTVNLSGDVNFRAQGTGVGSIVLAATSNLIVPTGVTLTTSGIAAAATDFAIASGGKITLNGTAVLDNKSGTNGTLAGAGAITLNGTSKYIHDHAGLTLQGSVAGTVVYNTGTTCEVRLGAINGTLGGVGQSFQNFIYNSSAQTGAVNCNGVNMTVAGNFEVQNTGNTAARALRFTANGAGQTVNITGNLIVSGLNGIAVLDLASGTGNTAVTVGGNIIIGGNSFSSTLGTTGTGATSIKVKGNWTNGTNGVFTPGAAGTVEFNGTAANQSITKATGSETFNNLVINNSFGGTGVTLANSATVNTVLTLTAGRLTTGANAVTVAAAAGLATGGSTNYVNGNLVRAVAAGASTVAFPIGDATNYSPVSLTFGAGNTAGNVTASTTVPGAAPASGNAPTGSGISQTKYINRNWTLSTTIASPSYAATFTYINAVGTDVVGGANLSSLIIGKNVAGTWSNPIVSSSSAPAVTTATGQTTFGVFSLGEGGCTNVGLTSATATASPICSSATTTLTYSGLSGTNASVTWYDGTTGTSGPHGTGTPSSPVGPGTYHARATGDCGSPVEITVIVGAKVNVALSSATATASPICSAATTTLTYSGLSGDGSSVTWYDGSGATGGTHGTGTPSSAVGPGTYYAYATGDCGSPVEIQVIVGTSATTVITTDAAPSSQTVLVNDPSPTNLTVTATGAALTYQWFSNGSNSNAGGTTVGAANGGQTNTFTPPTNVLGTKYYYAVVTGTCGTVTSSAVAVTITNTNTWKGGGTTNWSLGSNWTSGLVPTGANDAAIPVGNTPYPVLSVSSSINDLIIDPGATVGIGAGNTFTITGVVSGAGTISGSVTSNLVTSASTTINFTPGANTLKDLTVSAGTTTLSNALNITGGTAANTYGTVTVAPGATLASGGNLTIKSNQFGTARVAAGDVAGNYITGDVTVERYIPQNSKRAWRLLSVPTKGTKTIKQTWQENQAAGANGTPGFGTIITSNIATAAPLQAAGFDAYSQLPSMQSYNSATQGWVYVTSTNAAPIQSNKGYFLYIRGDRSVTTSSSTDAASATTLRTTGTLYQGNSNPAVSIAAGKFEPVGNTFASAIDFTSLSKTGGISNTFYVWDSKLLSGTTLGAYQTFNGSIGYTPATPGGSYPAGVPNTSIESGEAFMLGATGTAGTVTLVEASKTAGNQFTPFRPAALPAQFKTGLLKVTGSTTVLADNNIVVFDNAYKNAVDADDALKIQKAGETMSIVTDGKALIIDARQPVSSTDVISFNISNLQPQAYKLSFSTQNMNTAGLTAFVEDKYLQTSTAINLDGVSDYGFTADAANAASSAPDRFRVVFKKAGAMAIAATKAGFSISPNPVEGGVVNVQFKNQLAGKYSIRLLDAGGAVIFSTFATHGGGSSTQVLGLPGGVARGAYQLEITSPSKERELQTLFINSIK